MAESEQFERGLEIRREVLGADYVDANLAGTDEFMMGFQRLLTEWVWGYAWSRPGLDRKTRSMLNLAILTALGRPQELGIYVKGALSTGVSVAVGIGVAERISEMAGPFGDKPDVSGIYRFLKKMQAAGLVTSSWETGGQGHAKRLFEITDDGRDCLTRWTTTLEAYLKTLASLLKEAKAATVRRPRQRRRVAAK